MKNATYLSIALFITVVITFCYVSFEIYTAHSRIDQYFKNASFIPCGKPQNKLTKSKKRYNNMIANQFLAESNGFLNMGRLEIELYYIAAGIFTTNDQKKMVEKIPCLRRN